MVKEKKGKNLFEVNGIKYADNIPKDMRISLTKEQYAEYLQQKELIERLQKENKELRKTYDKTTTEIEELKEQKEIDMYLIGDSISKEIVKRDYIPKDKIRDKLDEIMSYTFTSIEERNQQNYAYDRIRELLEEE